MIQYYQTECGEVFQIGLGIQLGMVGEIADH